MTDREQLRATSCESLLACLRDRLRAWEERLDDAYAYPDWTGVALVMKDLKAAADRIDMKLRMERGE